MEQGVSDTMTNPENVTTSEQCGDAVTSGGRMLEWTFIDDIGPSKGALAEIDRELKERLDNAMVLPDWKRKHHNRKRGS